MTRWFTMTSIFLGALSLAACGGDETSDADAGVDAGARVDAGGGSDSGSDAGMDSGASVDAGASDSATSDARIDWPDGGGVSDPTFVDLSVGAAGSCPGFTPCGGDVVGTWDLGGGCVEIDIESAISMCPGATVTRRVGRGRGRVVFGPTSAHRVAESIVEADTFFPAVCAAFFSCAMLEDAMAMRWTEATCTSMPSGDCNCTARQLTFIDDRDLYTLSGNEIVGGASGKRWAYCIAGDRFDYRDVSPSPPLEPGDVQLMRR